MKQIRLLSLFAVLFTALCGIKVYAQAVGDYGTKNTASTWATVTDWVVCVSDGTWDGATDATAIPTTASPVNVWIRNGHSMTIGTSGTNACKNLYVEANASIQTSGNKYSPRYIRVYGSTVDVKGNFGIADNGISIQMYGGATQVLTLTSSSTVYLCRIYPNSAAGAQLILDADVVLNYPGSMGTGGSAMFAGSTNDFTATINAGKSVQVADFTYIGGSGSSGVSAGNASLTLNVNGTLTMSGANSVLNMNVAAGKSVELNVSSAGTINTSGPVRAYYTNLGATNINVAEGGVLNTMSGSNLYASKANLNIDGTVNSESVVIDSIGTATIGSTGTINFLKAKGKIVPSGNITVNGTLALGVDTVVLADKNLTVSSTGSLLRSTGFVVTNGTGTVTMPAVENVSTLFPVGASVSSYDPVSVIPTATSNISVAVSSTLTVNPENYSLNQKEWKVTSETPSSTQITFTPSTMTASGTNAVIGKYNGTDYDFSGAALNGSSYTGTFNSFSAFVTGATDLSTEVETNNIAHLYVSVSNGMAWLSGVSKGQLIQIYNVNGKLVNSMTATATNMQLNITNGLYLIRTENEVIKVVL